MLRQSQRRCRCRRRYLVTARSGFTAKRAILYISLDGGKLKLVHVKTPANPTVNPKNKMWSYRFDEKGRFCDIAEWEEAEGEEE